MFAGLGSGRTSTSSAVRSRRSRSRWRRMAARSSRSRARTAPGRSSRQQYSPPHHGQHADGHLRPGRGPRALKTSADPTGRKVFGTLNNCAGGGTPWGTWLTCEENFNGYFGGDAAKLPMRQGYKRYGVRQASCLRLVDVTSTASISPRSPTSPTASAGWSRSIPTIPSSTPMKRTALGRFKHEGCTYTLAKDGRVVVLQRRRRALRLCLQVRHRAAVERQRPRRQQGPAGRRHALRRALRRRRQGRLAAAGPRPGPADRRRTALPARPTC